MGVPENDPCPIAVEPGHCDLHQASYDAELSSAGRDEDQHVIYMTVDRVAYRPAPEVVDKVLAANGFALNLENILACLDELRVGYRVRPTNHAALPNTIPVAQAFIPALTLKLPAKNRVGPLLAKFYAEVDRYQAELAQLREEKGRSQGDRRRELDEVRKERDRLREQNLLLQVELEALSRELVSLKKAHADATRALAEQNALPAQVRLAQVHDVDLDRRHVALKSGRKVFSVPLVALWVFPEKEDPCLVSIQDGQVSGVFFHEGSPAPPGMVIGEVLHVARGRCKIREENRRTRVIRAQNPAEEELIHQMRRGHRVLLFLHEDELIRFTPCGAFDPETFVRAVQESITRWEITQSEDPQPDGTEPP